MHSVDKTADIVNFILLAYIPMTNLWCSIHSLHSRISGRSRILLLLFATRRGITHVNVSGAGGDGARARVLRPLVVQQQPVGSQLHSVHAPVMAVKKTPCSPFTFLTK